ncbi:hypothetical protein WJX72_001928 [[Myrmecia] bisecta]|uniref:Uncharacterized protein n=1 Tax=[Myrmecia] bisecta TaxID=41462 RepID=A0AAW1PP09_9CHLO
MRSCFPRAPPLVPQKLAAVHRGGLHARNNWRVFNRRPVGPSCSALTKVELQAVAALPEPFAELLQRKRLTCASIISAVQEFVIQYNQEVYEKRIALKEKQLALKEKELALKSLKLQLLAANSNPQQLQGRLHVRGMLEHVEEKCVPRPESSTARKISSLSCWRKYVWRELLATHVPLQESILKRTGWKEHEVPERIEAIWKSMSGFQHTYTTEIIEAVAFVEGLLSMEQIGALGCIAMHFEIPYAVKPDPSMPRACTIHSEQEELET